MGCVALLGSGSKLSPYAFLFLFHLCFVFIYFVINVCVRLDWKSVSVGRDSTIYYRCRPSFLLSKSPDPTL